MKIGYWSSVPACLMAQSKKEWDDGDMANGKAGDHWLTDLLAHNISRFEDADIEGMVRTLVKLGAVEQLEEIVNDILSRQSDMPSQVLRRPEIQSELRLRLAALMKETSRDRDERGWET